MIKIKKHNSLITIKRALPLLLQLYPNKTRTEVISGLKIMLKQHKYSLLVAYKNKEPIGIAGINIGYLLYCDKFLRISNLYINPEHRNEGIAQLLINEGKKIATKQKCSEIILDSYVENRDSHKLYLKENFAIKAYHFSKEL